MFRKIVLNKRLLKMLTMDYLMRKFYKIIFNKLLNQNRQIMKPHLSQIKITNKIYLNNKRVKQIKKVRSLIKRKIYKK